ncbi:MAG: hypothetical protein NT129_00015 [Candidatus Aenigmarchaeota archaeon]|nr:hypothetical protein [Candidatus Aenigmarchaeota archaeon]
MFESEFLTTVSSFLFVFAIIYAIFVYSKLFSESRNAAVLISLVIAFFAVAYSPFVEYMQSYMPIAALVLVLIFFAVLVKKLFFEGKGGGQKAEKDAVPAMVVLAVLLIVLGLLWNRIGMSLPGISSESLLWIIGVFVIILIFIAAYKHPRE